MLVVEPHPVLKLEAFITEFPRPLGDGYAFLTMPILLDAAPTMVTDDKYLLRAFIGLVDPRQLKQKGVRTPRGLQRAAAMGKLPAINPAVDVCHVASMSFGLPISVIDMHKTKGILQVGKAPEGAHFGKTRDGQPIDAQGQLCLRDRGGACASPLREARRVLARKNTTRTLSLIWGARSMSDDVYRATQWYRGMLNRAGARTTDP